MDSPITLTISIALVVLTGGLVYFTRELVRQTGKLAQHTEALAKITHQLVLIEKRRDYQHGLERRRIRIEGALDHAGVWCTLNPEAFIQRVLAQESIGSEKTAIHELSLFSDLIDDPECMSRINKIRKMLDIPYAALREDISSLRYDVIKLQGELGGYVYKWRAELTSQT